MYFVKRGCEIYHILSDASTGSALCGVAMSNLEMWEYRERKAVGNVTEEKPTDKPLCKHCERMTAE
jgi:hypothetical protein